MELPLPLEAKEAHNKFKFKCTKCGKCCDSTMIGLYPFDIKLICDNLHLSTEEFHQKYSLFTIDETHIVRCLLHNRFGCKFKDKENLCTIYKFRPIRCRLFPVGRFYNDEKIHYLLSNFPSPGFESNKKQSFAEWAEEQGVTPFNQLTEDWNTFIIKLKEHPRVAEKNFQQLFKKVFYHFENKRGNNEENQEESLEEFMQRLYHDFDKLSNDKLSQ
ncbi:MAG TPA: YkgJ family cysteine cluster protein [Candidatus Nanoarchaeia archaeon]|nr:YkgJ family cysteine cluster protein [Candidatus Nanoarchaeia archaeon]